MKTIGLFPTPIHVPVSLLEEQALENITTSIPFSPVEELLVLLQSIFLGGHRSALLSESIIPGFSKVSKIQTCIPVILKCVSTYLLRIHEFVHNVDVNYIDDVKDFIEAREANYTA